MNKKSLITGLVMRLKFYLRNNHIVFNLTLASEARGESL